MSTRAEKIEEVKKHIQSYADFPKTGVIFRDIFSVLKQPRIFGLLRDVMVDYVKGFDPPIQAVVGLESRGFLFGPLLSLQFEIPFIPIRKKGKLPGPIKHISYDLEYGTDMFEIQESSLKKGDRVLIVDDLLATGGSLSAACKLIEMVGAEVQECLVIIELTELKGRDKIPNKVHSFIEY